MDKKMILLSNGETYSYLEKGNGEHVIIFIHGNMSSGVHFKPLFDILPENYKAYAPDLRGFGDSTYKNKIYSLYDLADDIYDFINILQIKKFTLVGWSTGGAVAMYLSAKHSEYVEKLILLESCAFYGYPIYRKDEKCSPIRNSFYNSIEEMSKDPVQVLPMQNAFDKQDFNFMNRVWNSSIYTVNKPSEEDNKLFLNETLKQKNLFEIDWGLANFNMSNKNNGYSDGDSSINNLEVPVISFWGDKDLVVTKEMVRDTVEAIGENAQMIILENSGHSPLIDSLDQIAKAIYSK